MRTAALFLVAFGLAAAGCRVSGPTTVGVSSERYGAAFGVVKDELRSQGFELERVDARAGVITTRPRASSGFWTPWVTYERRLRDEVESSLHRQRRVVEVRFAPAGGGEAAGELGGADVREVVGDLTLGVRVRVERVYQPGVRTPAASVRLRHVSADTTLSSRVARDDAGAIFAVDQGADRALAADLAARLRRALERGG